MVSDIKKLRPELLEKSDAELARLEAEIALAREHKRREADIKAKEELAAEANSHIDAVLAGVKFLHDNGILPQRVVEALSRGDGQFNPATFLRNVSAEQLVPRAAGQRKPAGERRRRRVRDPKTGELVPSKASQQG